MLSLQVAELYATMMINMSAFNVQMARIRANLASIPSPVITITANATQAVAAANGAASAQIAAGARVQAAHQASVAAQTAAATKAYAARVALGNQMAAAHVATANRAAAQAAAASAASRKQFAMGAGMGLGLPFATSPAMMGGQALGMGISAIGDGLKASAETAIDLEAKMAEVRRVAGLSADETGRLKQELIDISTVQPGVAIDDLVKMADIGGRMGIKGGELKEFASGLAMVKNSVAGMETEDLANNMARVLHVFQLGPEYIKGFGSALTAMDVASTRRPAPPRSSGSPRACRGRPRRSGSPCPRSSRSPRRSGTSGFHRQWPRRR
jgi:hypothetical protein